MDRGIVTEIPHPVRDSTAWQWVQKSVVNNGMTNYTIRLALKPNSDNVVLKRQTDGSGGGSVFFDDIDIMPTEVGESPSG